MYFILSPIDNHVQQESTLFAFESHDKLHWSVGCILLSQGPVFSSLAFSGITCIHELDFEAKHGLPITHSGSKILG